MSARFFRVFLSPEILLISLCFVGLLIFHGHRAYDLLWTDEIITLRNTSRGWIELTQNRYWAGHSPLYFALMKLWGLLVSSVSGTRPSELSEISLRLPSMMAVGAAGGMLGAAAWRSWAPACGLLFVPLWVLSPVIGRYFVEARPWSLLLLALSLGIWSSARLWSLSGSAKKADKETRSASPLWILSTASPVLAAATLPVGIPAVVASELTAMTLLGKAKSAAFVRRWKRRTALVLALVAVVLAFMAPAVRYEATNFWADKTSPLSLETVWSVADQVLMQRTGWIGLVLVFLAASGLYVRRNDFLGRISAGLALAFPILMIGLSAVNSVLVPRYFLPAIPGFLLLAVGLAASRLNARTLVSIASVVIVSFALSGAPSLHRVGAYQAKLHLKALKGVQVEHIYGAVTHPHIRSTLSHYIPRKLGIPVELKYIDQPLRPDELPEDGIFWIFDHRNKGSASHLADELNVLCRFEVKKGQIYVVARPRTPLPFDATECGRQH